MKFGATQTNLQTDQMDRELQMGIASTWEINWLLCKMNYIGLNSLTTTCKRNFLWEVLEFLGLNNCWDKAKLSGKKPWNWLNWRKLRHIVSLAVIETNNPILLMQEITIMSTQMSINHMNLLKRFHLQHMDKADKSMELGKQLANMKILYHRWKE